jgi:hypothetical protein
VHRIRKLENTHYLHNPTSIQRAIRQRNQPCRASAEEKRSKLIGVCTLQFLVRQDRRVKGLGKCNLVLACVDGEGAFIQSPLDKRCFERF